MQQITNNVYVESERSVCNTSIVVTTEGVVVIDTPMVPANAKKFAAEIAKFGPVRYVINTEPHGDHISGNCYFGGTLVGYEGTRDAILAAKVTDLEGMLKMMSPDSLPIDKDFRYRPSEITFTEKMTLYLGRHTFQLIHMPGHSPNQVAVYAPEERIIFTSDNIVAGGTPFFRQAVLKEWPKTIKKMQALDFDRLVPGHGLVQSKSYLPEMAKLVQTWVGAVSAAIEKGMTVEEAQEKVPLAKEFSHLPKDERTKGIIRMNVAAIYEKLKK